MPSQQARKANSKSEEVILNSPDSCNLIMEVELPITKATNILGCISFKTCVKTALRKKSYIGWSKACKLAFGILVTKGEFENCSKK